MFNFICDKHNKQLHLSSCDHHQLSNVSPRGEITHNEVSYTFQNVFTFFQYKRRSIGVSLRLRIILEN